MIIGSCRINNRAIVVLIFTLSGLIYFTSQLSSLFVYGLLYVAGAYLTYLFGQFLNLIKPKFGLGDCTLVLFFWGILFPLMLFHFLFFGKSEPFPETIKPITAPEISHQFKSFKEACDYRNMVRQMDLQLELPATVENFQTPLEKVLEYYKDINGSRQSQ